ncbi:MAG: carboxypeptidase regulatory-like domain-containing protein [Planctomycetota bacterium]
MKLSSRTALILASLCVSSLAAGCADGGPKLGQVSGTVTLDGQPLAPAKVEFQPQEAGGSPSYGTTDESGRYELTFSLDRPGAMIGKHLVRITTYRQLSSQDPGGPGELPERVPPKYNANSELIREVESGHNSFDFQL